MTKPVINQQSPLVDKTGKVIPPWNSFFQQFTEAPSAIESVTIGTSPFSYQPNNVGQVFVRGGTVSDISLIRGIDGSNPITINMTGALSVLVSIGDVVKVTYSVKPTLQFAEL